MRVSPAEKAAGVTLEQKARRTKYGNQKVVLDGITFDSKKEAARYASLKVYEKGGLIRDLMMQVSFVICPEVTFSGRKQAAVRYVADFTYYDEAGSYIVEDVKGVKTDLFILKRKLMKAVHGIEVQLV